MANLHELVAGRDFVLGPAVLDGRLNRLAFRGFLDAFEKAFDYTELYVRFEQR